MTDVLAVFPHPDDETWIAGGLLASAARRGLTVRLVCLTRGEHGWDRTGSASSADALGALREAEFGRACTALGVEDRLIADLPDGELSAAEVSDVIRRELAQLRREGCAPRYLLSFGPSGGYGHVDHVATYEAIRALVDEGAMEEISWLVALATENRAERLWRILARLRTARPLVVDDFLSRRSLALKLPSVGVPLESASVEAKLSALRAHRSQLREGDPRSFLDEELMASLLTAETVGLAGGSPAALGGFVREVTG